ncbi:hypothetical protein KKG22_03525 [Patescibacteria group bacterium]|nr:hypothetical protein [Patescibacteria group bacterium]MBU1721220.1 hypothetical protein [Patescibacteria group bacterium]MBU1901072.1 hypothetical protein [Patescibacteria group bacterium]
MSCIHNQHQQWGDILAKCSTKVYFKHEGPPAYIPPTETSPKDDGKITELSEVDMEDVVEIPPMPHERPQTTFDEGLAQTEAEEVRIAAAEKQEWADKIAAAKIRESISASSGRRNLAARSGQTERRPRKSVGLSPQTEQPYAQITNQPKPKGLFGRLKGLFRGK